MWFVVRSTPDHKMRLFLEGPERYHSMGNESWAGRGHVYLGSDKEWTEVDGFGHVRRHRCCSAGA